MNYLEQILAYARAGIPVFPCKKDKSPYTKHGFKDATCREKQIVAWWSAWPDALIGVPTGHLSGVDVLDIDAKKGRNGFEHVPGWESLSPVIARTMNGGAHIYFKHSGVTCSTGENGVDIRGDGGYVIVPPSPGYTWMNGSDFSSLPSFPDSLRPAMDDAPRESAEPQAEISRIEAAMAVMPNDDLDWDNWNLIGMATWRASGGSEEGFAAFDEWSKKSRKYNYKETRERWENYGRSPPNSVGAGTIFHNSSAGNVPMIVSLRKRLDDDPTYFVGLQGLPGELQCTGHQLWDYRKFEKLAWQKWNHVFDHVKPKHWKEKIRQASLTMTEFEPTKDTKIKDVVRGYLINYLRRDESQGKREREYDSDVDDTWAKGMYAWYDKKKKRYVFKLEAFMGVLRRDLPREKLERSEVGAWIIEWGGGTDEVKVVGGSKADAYWMPDSALPKRRYEDPGDPPKSPI